jgi:iron(III) transport system permease protein
VWQHLIETQLFDLLTNTLILFVGVGIWVLILGVSLAWLAAMCEFPGRRWFEWALMLPLAMPAYVFAFVFLGFIDYSGPLQTWYRQLFGENAFFPHMRGAFGVLLAMSAVLYPYVYMLARSAFISQGHTAINTARLLGLSPWGSFFRVVLPISRPAIAAGVALALMEALADFGVVSIFNFDTFTTAIYKSWFGLFNMTAAAQLASLLLLFVGLALYMEQRLRRKGKVCQYGHDLQRFHLHGLRAWGAFGYCFAVVLIAFIIPVSKLVFWVFELGWQDFDSRFISLIGHTLILAASAAFVIVSLALLATYGQRIVGREKSSVIQRIALLGYAFPGTVLAVGIMIPFAYFDRQIWTPIAEYFQWHSSQFLLGSLAALLVAYIIRFFSVGFGPVSTALERIKPVYQEVSQTLGVNRWPLLRRLYIPMMSTSIFTAILLALVDIMKEMPATLLLRPFGWDTLAVRIYEMTSEGEWERAALPALVLVILSLFPVMLIIRYSRFIVRE